jgi:hypothetical protein
MSRHGVTVVGDRGLSNGRRRVEATRFVSLGRLRLTSSDSFLYVKNKKQFTWLLPDSIISGLLCWVWILRNCSKVISTLVDIAMKAGVIFDQEYLFLLLSDNLITVPASTRFLTMQHSPLELEHVLYFIEFGNVVVVDLDQQKATDTCCDDDGGAPQASN